MSNLASPIIHILEESYATLRTHHPDLPEHIVFRMDGGAKANGVTWGHYHAGQWAYVPKGKKKAEDIVPEVMISGECLAAGAEQVFQTLVHEATHALAKVREVKDTSRQGRYHNKRFVKLAEELGMHYPHEGPDTRIGWSAVELTDETKALHADTIAKIGEVIEVAKGFIDTMAEPIRPLRTVVCVVIECDDAVIEFEVGKGTYEKIQEGLLPHEAHEEER